MPKLNDYELVIKGKHYRPIMVGGMGVDISTAELAAEAARLGGIGHISDAMAPVVCDRQRGTKFQAAKVEDYKKRKEPDSKTFPGWPYEIVYASSRNHAEASMNKKKGEGAIFVNIMERLTMGAPQKTLEARLKGALDGGVDGVTLAAGLHNSSLRMMQDHPRFNDAAIGIIVSSLRALKIFLRGSSRTNRLPDYVVVEGPLAGGHLGFGEDWAQFSLKNILVEIVNFLKEQNLRIPVIPAGGIFTGTDAVEMVEAGAAGVQVATRFTITKESGLPPDAKQVFFNSQESDIVVNTTSPAGYLMRMLRCSPSLKSDIRPNCSVLGYLLDKDGKCCYTDIYDHALSCAEGKKFEVSEKMCICHFFMRHGCYTCGHYVYRLKDTTVKLPDGTYYVPPMEDVFNDYLNSEDHQIKIPGKTN